MKKKRVPFVEKEVGLWAYVIIVILCRPKIGAGDHLNDAMLFFLRPWHYKNRLILSLCPKMIQILIRRKKILYS